MKYLHFILVMLTALCFSTAALADMPCCKAMLDAAEEMPCHPTADDDGNMDMSSGMCQCACGVQATLLPDMPKPMTVAQGEPLFTVPSHIVPPPEAIENPPKLHS